MLWVIVSLPTRMEEAFLKLNPNPTGLYNISSAHGNLMPKHGQRAVRKPIQTLPSSASLPLPLPPQNLGQNF